MKKNEHLTYCEIDSKALRHNLKEIAKLTAKNIFDLPTRPRSKQIIKSMEMILPVIKADAYGHGVEKISMLLDKAGVGSFGVSDIQEGIELREIGMKKPILLFESTLASQARKIVHYRLTPTVCTRELAEALQGITIEIHEPEELSYAIAGPSGFPWSQVLLVGLVCLLVGEQALAYSASYHPAPGARK